MRQKAAVVALVAARGIDVPLRVESPRRIRTRLRPGQELIADDGVGRPIWQAEKVRIRRSAADDSVLSLVQIQLTAAEVPATAGDGFGLEIAQVGRDVALAVGNIGAQ